MKLLSKVLKGGNKEHMEELQDALKTNQEGNTASPKTNIIDDIPLLEPSSSFDATAYEGFRVKIADVSTIDAINWYNGPTEDGRNNSYNPNSTEPCKKVVVTTEPLPVLKEGNVPTEEILKLGNPLKEVTVSQRFNLSRQVDSEGKITWGISKHEKGKLWKFMRKLNVTKLSELIGKYVIITTEPSRDENDDRLFLRIVC